MATRHREIRVAYQQRSGTLSAPRVRRAVAAVLDAERTGPVSVNITFLPGPSMRALNRRARGRDRATDVIAFAMTHAGRLIGDIYVCPGVARRSARRYRVTLREELTRLVIHGTLHLVGYDHPDGAGRVDSVMWGRQESYVRMLTSGGA